jgi:hypothetical protein
MKDHLVKVVEIFRKQASSDDYTALLIVALYDEVQLLKKEIEELKGNKLYEKSDSV